MKDTATRKNTDALPLDELSFRVDRALEHTPADETEVVWTEVIRGSAEARGKKLETRSVLDRTVIVRVIDLGRMGGFRTGDGDPAAIENGIRQALAQSRVKPRTPELHHFPHDEARKPPKVDAYDPAIAQLSRDTIQGLLKPLQLGRESLRLTWTDARIIVSNSRGLRRRAHVTAARCTVRCGRGPGAGRATDTSRHWQDLGIERIVETARARHATGPDADLPSGEIPLCLSSEATAELVALLNRTSFTAASYGDGGSFLREHLGVQVFDRRFDLVDDGTDPAGLPIPFDLEGTVKQPIGMIVQGTPRTPALDQRQAARLGLPPTGHSIGANDARAEHLFMRAGDTPDHELPAAADGGLWIGALDRVECSDTDRVEVRAHARNVRRIEGGRLAAAVPDLVLQMSLLRAFSGLRALGDTRSRRLGHDGFTGGIVAPAVVFSPGASLRLLTDD